MRGSGSESSARLLHRWQPGLGLGERSRANVDARGLGGDRDLLPGSRVASRALLLRRLDPDGQLDKTANANLLRVAELLQHDLLQRPEDPLSVGPGDLGAVSDSARELCLSQRQQKLLHRFRLGLGWIVRHSHARTLLNLSWRTVGASTVAPVVI